MVSGIIDIAFSKQKAVEYFYDRLTDNFTKRTIYAENTVFCRLGVRYTFSKKAIQPFLEIGGGICPIFKPQEYGGDICPDLYGGGGIRFRLSKERRQSIVFRVLVDKLSELPGTYAWALSGSLGYTF